MAIEEALPAQKGPSSEAGGPDPSDELANLRKAFLLAEQARDELAAQLKVRLDS